MARTRRTVLVTALSAALAISVLAGPTAQAQGGPFCAILSAAEVSAAVGAEMRRTTATDRSCNYASTAQDVFTFLNVTNGGTRMEVAKSIFEDGADVTVAGQPGWLKTGGFDSYLWIDRGDGDTLLVPAALATRGGRCEGRARRPGGPGQPRLATLAIPSRPRPRRRPPSSSRTPSSPRASQPRWRYAVQVQTITEGLTMEPEAQAQVEQLLATQGKTLSDPQLRLRVQHGPAVRDHALGSRCRRECVPGRVHRDVQHGWHTHARADRWQGCAGGDDRRPDPACVHQGRTPSGR